MGSGTHERLDTQSISDIDMSGSIQRRSRMVGRNYTAKVRRMRGAPIKRRIHRKLALRNIHLLHLRCAPLHLRMNTRTVHRRFLQVEFEPAEDDGVQAV